MVQPGWYGYDFDATTEARHWEAFRAANRDRLRQRKTWSSGEWTAVLLEVTAPVDWTYPGGLPKPAPKRQATTLQDLTGEPDVSPGLAVMAERAAAGGVKFVEGASNTLVIVAAAVLAFYLVPLIFAARRTSAPQT
jgi:hypothetical protein